MDSSPDDESFVSTGAMILIEDSFSRLPAEIRCIIYEDFVLPTATYTREYPLQLRAPPMNLQPIADITRRTRLESSPIVYRNLRLIITARLGFTLPNIPRSITAAIPSFARDVAYLRVVANVHLPLTVGFHPDIQAEKHISTATFVFEKTAKVFKVTATSQDPSTERGREVVRPWMAEMSAEFKAKMLGALRGGVDSGQDDFVEEEGSPFLMFVGR